MTATDFDVDLFERRLHTLKDSQESIQSLSAWCLERRQHHKKIVATWLQVLKKVKVEHRLTLFYLANDVIQYSKRKNFEFVESWGTTLQRATTMVRDEKVKHRILRIFKIWDQRQVYDEEFLADLSGLISAAPKKKQDPQPLTQTEEFQAALLISTMRSCATLEQATDARLRDLRDSNVDIENAEELCSSLKDRRRVEDAEKEVETAVRNVENYVRALEAEIRERAQVLELLEQADQFYETQRGEVKIVTNAYRNFGSRVKNLKKKLDELLPTLVSPIPSPDINAPSPSPDSDIELPEDNQIINVPPPTMYGSYQEHYEPMPVIASDALSNNETGDFTTSFSSFMGGNVDFDMRNLFNDRSATPTGTSQRYSDTIEAKPIEVINTRPPKNENSNDEDFSISQFLKTVLPSSDTAPISGGIPGLGLDLPEPQIESPQRPDYSQSPAMGQLGTPNMARMIGSQAPTTPIGNVNNCQMSHGTPLPVMRNLSGESHTPSPYSSQNSQFDGSVNSNVVNPLPPPPLPPPIFLDDDNCYNKLPPKFPTWTSANDISAEPQKWEDKEEERWDSTSNAAWTNNAIPTKNNIDTATPESPPHYEKAGFTDPIEYDDSQNDEGLLSSTGDVDHRVLSIPMPMENPLTHRLTKAVDVDHRNLISLTGSPANHSNLSGNEPPLHSVQLNNNNLWSSGEETYRQPGDIVESVDMDLSDDEGDGRPKNRVLVDVRPQDCDMRTMQQQMQQPMPNRLLDMDMRVVPPDIRNHQKRPPEHINMLPPGSSQQQQQQQQFHSNQIHHLNFQEQQQKQQQQQQQQHQKKNLCTPEFKQNQDFEFQDRRGNQDTPRNRYNQHQQSNRETIPNFNRNDRGNRGGRGFQRNRRDRYSDEHNHHQQRFNNRRRSPDGQAIDNNRPGLLETPLIPAMPVKDSSSNVEEEARGAGGAAREGEAGLNNSRQTSNAAAETSKSEKVETVSAETIDKKAMKETTDEVKNEESPQQLSQQLEAFMNSGSNDLKRQSANGANSFEESHEVSPMKKRTLLPNGPPPGIMELHPVVVYDYDSHGGFPAPWRGNFPNRGRGGGGNCFRGSPRGPWIDRGPRGMHPLSLNPPTNFIPRGMKRGGGPGQFRGGFRGRGRGNW